VWLEIGHRKTGKKNSESALTNQMQQVLQHLLRARSKISAIELWGLRPIEDMSFIYLQKS
jgi:hypothetical protein